MIAIYCKDNGLGLSKDARILVSTLRKFTEEEIIVSDPGGPLTCRVAIHVEIPAWHGMRQAEKNVLIPNPEWYMWRDRIGEFDHILAKTRDAETRFSEYNSRTVYSGFSLPEQPYPPCRKEGCIHIRGGSDFKGTNSVLDAWRKYPDLPPLTVYSHHNILGVPENVELRVGKFSESVITNARNSAAISVQPSMAEGFGYVLWEAVDAGNILITTDAPPMNEVTGFHAKAAYVGEHWMGSKWEASPDDIALLVRYASNLSPSEVYQQVRSGKNRLRLMSSFFEEILKMVVLK